MLSFVNHQIHVQIAASVHSTKTPAIPIPARFHLFGNIHESETLQYKHGVSTRIMTPSS